MKQFIERLPGFKGRYTNELISIAFYHFMSGKEMYFDKEYVNGFKLPITTQAGFKNAVLENSKMKMSEKSLDRLINEYNTKHITPAEHIDLHRRLTETYDRYYELERIYKFSIQHPIKYFIHRKKINQKLKEMGVR